MTFGEKLTSLRRSQNYTQEQFANLLGVSRCGRVGIVPKNVICLRLESTENCYVEWRCRPIDLIKPIFDVRFKIQNRKDDISNSELKKMAKKAAAEVAMRIKE